MSEFYRDCIFDILLLELRASAPHRTTDAKKSRFCCEATPCISLCLNSIFHLLVQPNGYFLPLIATPGRFGPRARAADEGAAALNSFHSTPSIVYLGIL